MEQHGIPAGQEQAGVDRSLDATVRRFTEALNRLDAREFVSCWTDDGTLVNPFGNYGRGRSEIERVFHEDPERFLQGSTTTVTVTGARRIADDCVLLDLDHDVQDYRRPDGSRGPVKMHAAILAQKVGDEWKWLDVRAYFIQERPQALH